MRTFYLSILSLILSSAVIADAHRCIHDTISKPKSVIVPQNYPAWSHNTLPRIPAPEEQTSTSSSSSSSSSSSVTSTTTTTTTIASTITSINGEKEKDTDKDKDDNNGNNKIGSYVESRRFSGNEVRVNGTSKIRITMRNLWSRVGIHTDQLSKIDEDFRNARKFLEQVLYVIPVEGNLRFGKNDDCFGGNEDSFWADIPPEDFSAGVSNSDVVFYVKEDKGMPPGVLAHAGVCLRDEKSRPVVSYIAIDPANYAASSNSWFIVVHEALHALGFTSDSFQNHYRDPLNVNRTLPAEEVVKTVSRTYKKATYDVSMMITPKVMEVARLHFRCATLPGVELESQGGLGTAGSHWEKRLYDNDFMTGDKSENPIISPLTFAALQDSTWYAVDFSKIPNALEFGAGEGCNFAQDNCMSPAWENHVCLRSNGRMCKADRLSRGLCTVCQYGSKNCLEQDAANGVEVPTQYQYVFDADGNLNVGRNMLSDYCPLADNWKSCEGKYIENEADGGAAVYGSSSRCYNGDLALSSYPMNIVKGGQCFEEYCKNANVLVVKLASGDELLCTEKGQILKGDTAKYKGSITCPDVEAVCRETVNDIKWPTLDYVTPSTGRKGSTITIVGKDFAEDTVVELQTAKGEPFSCVERNLITDGGGSSDVSKLNCTLPPSFAGSVSVKVIDPTSDFSSVSAPGAFKIDIDTSDEIPDSGGGVSFPEELSDLGNAAADAATGWWDDFSNACGGTIPCWAYPIIVVVLLIAFCAFCCCRKKKNKKKQEEYEMQQYNQQQRQPPHLANRGGGGGAKRPPGRV